MHCKVKSPLLCPKPGKRRRGHCKVKNPLLCPKPIVIQKVPYLVESLRRGHCKIKSPLLCPKPIVIQKVTYLVESSRRGNHLPGRLRLTSASAIECVWVR